MVWHRLPALAAWCGLGLLAIELAPVRLHSQEPATPPAATTPETPTLPPTDVVGEQQGQGPATNYQPGPVPDGSILAGTLFTGPPIDGYYTSGSTTGSWINIPDIELPATVSTITPDEIRDQQALRLEDLLRNSGATVPSGGNGGTFNDTFYIRGQVVESRDFRKNGFFDPTQIKRDLQNVERIEILKGPASGLYGAGQPSGTVNFIAKKPIDGQFSNFQAQGGSFDLQRYTIDTNGYMSADGSLLYRVNAAYQDNSSFRDFFYDERTFVAPSVTWVIDPEYTTLNWSGEFLHERLRPDTGIAAIGNDPLALPINRYMGEPGNDFWRQNEYRQQLVLNHKFNDDWSLFVGGSSLFFDQEGSQTYAFAPTATPGEFMRLRQDYDAKEQAQSGIVALNGEVWTWDIKHQLTAGTEQVYYDADSVLSTNILYPNFNAFAPTYGLSQPIMPVPAFELDAPVFRQVRHGYFLQDFITLNERWQLLGDVRFDETHFIYVRTQTLNFPNPAPPPLYFPGPVTSVRTDEHFERVIPRAGVVYQLMPEIMSVYYNYSQSYNAPLGNLGVSQTVRAETGEMHEMGIKTQVTDTMSYTVAGFHIVRNNVPFAVLDQSGTPFFSQVGEQRSQGVEMNLVGQLTDRWSWSANYAYVDTLVTDSNNPFLPPGGAPQLNVPLNSGNVWTRYNFIQNDIRTFGAALGVIAMGTRTGNVDGSLLLPAYNRWDMGFYYQQGRFNANCFVENIFDQEYAQSSINAFQIMPGAPINARAQIGFVF